MFGGAIPPGHNVEDSMIARVTSTKINKLLLLFMIHVDYAIIYSLLFV